MSQGEDAQVEALIGQFHSDSKEKEEAHLLATKTWKKRTGKEIKVCDMQTNHIINSIKVLSSRTPNPNLIAWVNLFKEELRARKDV